MKILSNSLKPVWESIEDGKAPFYPQRYISHVEGGVLVGVFVEETGQKDDHFRDRSLIDYFSDIPEFFEEILSDQVPSEVSFAKWDLKYVGMCGDGVICQFYLGEGTEFKDD